ncbi:MAG: hypothetical protein LBE80_02910, partial [Deltaproteobacteria bacterium]|nr:hypothetical protein [Deltaproteobacteria bacterium]
MIRIKKNIFVQKKAFFKRLNFPLTVIILALAVFFIFPKRARSATIQEIFIMLPEERVMNLSPVDRRALIDKSGQGASGYTPPDERGFWVEIHGIHSLTLFSIRDAPINFKVFSSSKGWQLLAICRSRQTYGPANANETPHETFLDLILYSVSLILSLCTSSSNTGTYSVGKR